MVQGSKKILAMVVCLSVLVCCGGVVFADNLTTAKTVATTEMPKWLNETGATPVTDKEANQIRGEGASSFVINLAKNWLLKRPYYWVRNYILGSYGVDINYLNLTTPRCAGGGC